MSDAHAAQYDLQVTTLIGKALKLALRDHEGPPITPAVTCTRSDGTITVKVVQNAVLDGEKSVYLGSMGEYIRRQGEVAVDYKPSCNHSNPTLTISFPDAHDSLFRLHRAYRAMAVDTAADSLTKDLGEGTLPQDAMKAARGALAELLNENQIDDALSDACKNAGLEITRSAGR